MRSSLDMAWAAGLFEGEGCIEMSADLRCRDRTFVRLVVTSTDRDVLGKLMAVTGCGTVREIKAPSLAKINWKPIFTWRIGKASECERLLKEWLPFFGSRRTARAAEALSVLAEKAEQHRCSRCGCKWDGRTKGCVACIERHSARRRRVG